MDRTADSWTQNRPAREVVPSGQRVVVALPAYNEEEALEPLLNSLDSVLKELRIKYEIIVVDDGSTDDTALIVSQASFRMPVTLIEHEVNQGLAGALRTGLLAATELCSAEDIIFTLDADNTHPAGLMPRMLGMVREGHDVVIASRFQPGARVVGVPMHRHLLSVAARALFQVILPIRGVRDYTCGFRAYRAGVLQQAIKHHGDRFVSETGFSCMVDVLLKLRHQSPVVGEAPLILRYDRKGGVSKMNVSRTIYQTLSLIMRRRLRQK